MLELIIAGLSAVGNFTLAFFVLAKNRHRHMNIYFSGYALTLALWATSNYISLHPFLIDQIWWIRIVMLVVVGLCLFMMLLANTFPTGRPHFKNLPRLVAIPSVVAGILAMSPYLFTSVSLEFVQVQPKPGWAIFVYVPLVAVSLFVTTYLLVNRFIHLRGVAKEYVRYAIIGIITTVSFLLLTNLVFVLILNDSSLVAISPVFSLLFTVSFAYGMIRYRLFDLRLIVARLMAYVLLVLFVGVIYGMAVSAISFFIAGMRPTLAQIVVSTAVVSVLGLLVQPLRSFLNRITREVFYQDDYDTKHVLDDISSALVRATNTNDLANNVMSILITALKSEYVTMVVLDEGASGGRRVISVGDNVPDFTKLTDDVLNDGVLNLVVADASGSSAVDAMLKRSHSESVAIIARLETQGDIIGYCLFGYKASGSSYSHRDVDLVRIARDEMAVAIQNSLRFDQIHAFNDTLQQRVDIATKELRASNAQLQRLDEAKDEFVSMASHQLRTPLTSVKGYISMVLEGDVGPITATQKHLLDEAFTSSERMVHLINDFLNVSRLQTGKFLIDQRPTDLARVVGQELDSLKTTAEARNLELVYKKPADVPVLNLDEDKMRQVIMNFVDNALYYSPEGSKINIKLGIDDGRVELTVKDDGIGVPEDEQARLFSKFYRASNARKQRPDGTGVGLFLAKKVIDAHGGHVIFESSEGQGSTFGFSLPLSKLRAADNTDKLKD